MAAIGPLEESTSASADPYYPSVTEFSDRASMDLGGLSGQEFHTDLKEAIKNTFLYFGLDRQAMLDPEVVPSSANAIKQASRAVNSNNRSSPVLSESNDLTPEEVLRRAQKESNKERVEEEVKLRLSRQETEHNNRCQQIRRQIAGDSYWILRSTDEKSLTSTVTANLLLMQNLWAQDPDKPEHWLKRLVTQNAKGKDRGQDYDEELAKSDVGSVYKKFMALEKLEVTHQVDSMALRFDFALEVKTNEKTAERSAEYIGKLINKSPKTIGNYISEGTNIAHLCHAFSPDSLIGIPLLCMMGLTAARIGSLKQDQRVLLIAWLCPSLGTDRGGASSRLVPPPFHRLMDVLVDGIVPTLERRFVKTLKDCWETLHPLIQDRFLPPEGNDLNFRIRCAGVIGKEKPIVSLNKNRLQKFYMQASVPQHIRVLANGNVHLNDNQHKKCYRQPTKLHLENVLYWQSMHQLQVNQGRFRTSGERGLCKRYLVQDVLNQLSKSNESKLIPQVALWCGGGPESWDDIPGLEDFPHKDFLSVASFEKWQQEDDSGDYNKGLDATKASAGRVKKDQAVYLRDPVVPWSKVKAQREREIRASIGSPSESSLSKVAASKGTKRKQQT